MKQLERTLEVTYKTAWFMAHRLREAMSAKLMPPMGGKGEAIEADETYIGNKMSMKERRKKATYKQLPDDKLKKITKRGYGHKHTVVSLVERGGSVRSFHVESATTAKVSEILVKNVDRKSRLMTESRIYTNIGYTFAGQ